MSLKQVELAQPSPASGGEEIPYWVTPGLAASMELLQRALLEPSVGLALVAGPTGVGKSRFLASFVEGITAEPIQKDGVLLRVRPLALTQEHLVDVRDGAALARLIDGLILQAREVPAPQSSTVTTENAQPLREVDWFVLLVDDAARIPDEQRSLLLMHALMMRPQVALTVMADGPALLESVRDHISQINHLRRQLKICDVPAFTREEVAEFLRRVSAHFKHEGEWSEQQVSAAFNESLGMPGPLMALGQRVELSPQRMTLIREEVPEGVLAGGAEKMLQVPEMAPEAVSESMPQLLTEAPEKAAPVSPIKVGGRWVSGLFGFFRKLRWVFLLVVLLAALLIWMLPSQVASHSVTQVAKRIWVASIMAPSWAGGVAPGVQLVMSESAPELVPELIPEKGDNQGDGAVADLEFLALFDDPAYPQAMTDQSHVKQIQKPSAEVSASGLPGQALALSTTYDLVSALKTVFSWPAAAYVIQIDADESLRRLQARLKLVRDEFNQSVRVGEPSVGELILPINHRGRAGWIAVVGPYANTPSLDSLVRDWQALNEVPRAIWVRRAVDLQKAILRARQRALP